MVVTCATSRESALERLARGRVRGKVRVRVGVGVRVSFRARVRVNLEKLAKARASPAVT